jgi:Tfp pilus assembly protein PilZ
VEESVSLPVAERRLELVLNTPEAFRAEYTRNLSNGGAFVATEEKFELLELVHLQLDLPFAGDSFMLQAEVVQCQPQRGVSVQIIDPTPKLRMHLQAIFERAEELARASDDPIAAPGEDESGDGRLDLEPDVISLEDLGLDADWGALGWDDDAEAAIPAAEEVDDPNERTHQERAERVPIRVAVSVRGPNGKALHGRTRDLSTTGLLVLVDDADFPLGCDVLITLVHPTKGDSFDVLGSVIRHEEKDGAVVAIAVQIRLGENAAALARLVKELGGAR